jgi:hypothetical protein
VKYNLNYLTFIELIETGLPNQTVLTIRAADIEAGNIVASGSAVGTLPSIYKSAIDQIKTNLVNLNIEGVILPSLKQVKKGITELSPSDPLPGSLISSDLASLTPASILETAINKPTNDNTIPTSETVLSKETAKPLPNATATANIKPARIEQPASPNSEEPAKLTSPEQINAIAATSGNVAAIASTPVIQAQAQAPSITNNTINNNITNAKSESASNSNSVVNSKNVLNNEANSEKNTSSTSISEKTKNVIVESDPTAKMLETLIGIPQGSTKNEVSTVNQKSTNLSSVNKTKESIDSKISNVLKSTVDSQSSTSTNEEELTKENQAILNTLMGIPNTPESTDVNKTNINKTNTNESVNVKSTKLVESSSVKKMLEPDKTLEKSVGKLSKDLPAAVNNLSSSVTSMNPQTSSSSLITNEGNKVDQSSKTVINQNSGQTGPQEQTSRPQEMAQLQQNSDFYLQGIYAALMSGKIKVKLEYQ